MFKKFNYTEISSLREGIIGVYYCGSLLSNGNLRPFYIGKSSSEQGVMGRLLDHLENKYWPDVTHFGIEYCSNESEAVALEEREIKYYQPKYNTLGK